MTEAQDSMLQMEHAEQRGDHRTARALAEAIISSTPGAISPEENAARVSATELLRRTEPDPFLLAVGTVGLGVMVWLVYNYAL